MLKNFTTIYLSGEGLTKSGASLSKGAINKDSVRKEIAMQIFERLVNAYAMIEAGKAYGVFTDEYAENITKQAKDAENHNGVKQRIVSAIKSEIHSAMVKAGKESDTSNAVIFD